MDESRGEESAGRPGPGGAEGEVVILAPGDERSQKIGKAIASQAAGEILHALEKGTMTAGDLASALAMPMGTVKYHVDNLLEAGLIEIKDTKYSVKGRQVKVYGLRNQVLIVAPEVQSVRSILLKYAALFGVVALSSLAAYAILTALRPTIWGQDGGSLAGGGMAYSRAEKAVEIMTTPAPTSAPPAPLPQAIPADIALAFFFGGVLVIVILLLYEVFFWWRKKKLR